MEEINYWDVKGVLCPDCRSEMQLNSFDGSVGDMICPLCDREMELVTRAEADRRKGEDHE